MKTAAQTSWEVLGGAQERPPSSASGRLRSSFEVGADLWTLKGSTGCSINIGFPLNYCTFHHSESGWGPRADRTRAGLDSNEQQGGKWEGREREEGRR